MGDLHMQTPEYAKRTRHRLFVDNADAANLATSPFQFTVYLADPFRESIGTVPLHRVESVELKALAFPKIANEHYVILQVDQLQDDKMMSTNDAADQSFAVMYFDTAGMTTGDIKPMKGTDFWLKDLVFNPVIPTLTTLNVTFRKPDGNVVTAADTGNVRRCSFLLEITTQNV